MTATTEPVVHFSEPKAPQRTGKFQKGGRRLVSQAPPPIPPTNLGPSNNEKINFNSESSVEELDKMLEADALALFNIKKDINQTQFDELEKVRHNLMMIKKEYDNLVVVNSLKQKEYNTCFDKYSHLKKLKESSESCQNIVDITTQSLQANIETVIEEITNEERLLKMLQLMSKRYNDEINSTRIENSKLNLELEHLKHDLSLIENNLSMNRQNLIEKELNFNKLNSVLKSRKEERENKINMLQNLSLDGENNVRKLQNTFTSINQKVLSKKKKLNSNTTSLNNTLYSNNNNDDELKLLQMNSLDNFWEMDWYFLNDSNLEIIEKAKKMNVHQIRETLSRLKNQSHYYDNLYNINNILKNKYNVEVQRKKDLNNTLTHLENKINHFSSLRQVYQEVDSNKNILYNLTKEYDNNKKKNFNIKILIEKLRQSIPRFLTKITKVYHPKPNENQISDAVLKLEDELIKLIKLIGSILLKDATPDDLALISNNSSSSTSTSSANSGNSGNINENNLSEFGRLQRLPGFSRLQKQLFYNMMTAKLDTSYQNIRVDTTIPVTNGNSSLAYSATSVGSASTNHLFNNQNSHALAHNTKLNAGGSNSQHTPAPPTNPNINNYRRRNNNNVEEEEEEEEDEIKIDYTKLTEEPTLGRNTIKNISKLIIDRDSLKMKNNTKKI